MIRVNTICPLRALLPITFTRTSEIQRYLLYYKFQVTPLPWTMDTSCTFHVSEPKFEAQYQPCLATEPILSNPWKWQAGEVGKASKTHFSCVPTVLVIRVPNKGQD